MTSIIEVGRRGIKGAWGLEEMTKRYLKEYGQPHILLSHPDDERAAELPGAVLLRQ